MASRRSGSSPKRPRARSRRATLELLTKARELGSTRSRRSTPETERRRGRGGGRRVRRDEVVRDRSRRRRCPVRSRRRRSRSSPASRTPTSILFAQSYDGRDAIARLSVKLDRPVLTNGMSLSADGGLTFGTAIFGGVTLVDAKLTTAGPALIAIRPEVVRGRGVAAAARPRSSTSAAADAGRAAEAKVLERHVEEQQGPKLEEASVVVSGGRGIGAAENYAPARRGARQAAQGRVGRVACDRRRGLGAVRAAGRPDRQDREAEGVHRARHLGCDAAPRRHEEQRQHRRREQGRRGADLLGRRPRHRRRRAQGRARS